MLLKTKALRRRYWVVSRLIKNFILCISAVRAVAGTSYAPPAAARSNPTIYYHQNGSARTNAEVYQNLVMQHGGQGQQDSDMKRTQMTADAPAFARPNGPAPRPNMLSGNKGWGATVEKAPAQLPHGPSAKPQENPSGSPTPMGYQHGPRIMSEPGQMMPDAPGQGPANPDLYANKPGGVGYNQSMPGGYDQSVTGDDANAAYNKAGYTSYQGGGIDVALGALGQNIAARSREPWVANNLAHDRGMGNYNTGVNANINAKQFDQGQQQVDASGRPIIAAQAGGGPTKIAAAAGGLPQPTAIASGLSGVGAAPGAKPLPNMLSNTQVGRRI
jgi:hypothetical protein